MLLQNNPSAVTADSSGVYWADEGVTTDDGSIAMAAIGGTGAVTTLVTTAVAPVSLLTTPTDLYVVDYGTGLGNAGYSGEVLDLNAK